MYFTNKNILTCNKNYKMSLNKFTSVEKGKQLGFRIGCTKLDVDGDLTATEGDFETLRANTYIVQEELEVKDALILCGKDNTSDAVNLGLKMEYTDGTVRYAGVIRSKDDKRLYLLNNSAVKPQPNTDITSFEKSDLVCADVTCTSVDNPSILKLGQNSLLLEVSKPFSTTIVKGIFQVDGKSFLDDQILVGQGGAFSPSTLLELRSTNQGFLLPRMTQSQRDAIVSPVEGLEIWNLDTNQPNFYTGTSWSSGSGNVFNQDLNTFNAPSFRFLSLSPGPGGESKLIVNRNTANDSAFSQYSTLWKTGIEGNGLGINPTSYTIRDLVADKKVLELSNVDQSVIINENYKLPNTSPVFNDVIKCIGGNNLGFSNSLNLNTLAVSNLSVGSPSYSLPPVEGVTGQLLRVSGIGNDLIFTQRCLDSNVLPTSNDDQSQGYSINSLFTYTPNLQTFVCTKATTGSAVWREITKENLSELDDVQLPVLGFVQDDYLRYNSVSSKFEAHKPLPSSSNVNDIFIAGDTSGQVLKNSNVQGRDFSSWSTSPKLEHILYTLPSTQQLIAPLDTYQTMVPGTTTPVNGLMRGDYIKFNLYGALANSNNETIYFRFIIGNAQVEFSQQLNAHALEIFEVSALVRISTVGVEAIEGNVHLNINRSISASTDDYLLNLPSSLIDLSIAGEVKVEVRFGSTSIGNALFMRRAYITLL